MKLLSWVAATLFVALLLLSRWPLQPSVFVSFDNANFALGLERFSPAEHRPQPPGYPLFIDVARVIHWAVDDVHLVFFFTGILGSLIAVWMTWRLGTQITGPTGGLIAALLLIGNPVLWNAALMNPVRTWLAAGSAAIGWFAWRCWEPESSNMKWWLAAWLSLGIAAGFRPGLSAYLLPLLIFVGFHRRTSLSGWVAAALSLAAGVLPWLIQVIVAVGGVDDYISLLHNYLREQSETTSVVYGAAVHPAVRMAARASAWILVGAAGWIWFVRRVELPRFGFFAVWCLPAAAFALLVHSAEPGHVLSVVPPLCVVGGWVMAEARRWKQVVAVAVPVFLFFVPPRGPLRECSARGVELSEERVVRVLSELRAAHPETVYVATDATVAWRLISYYFPQMTVLVPQPDRIWHVRNNVLVESRPIASVDAADFIRLDSAGLHHPVHLPPKARVDASVK